MMHSHFYLSSKIITIFVVLLLLVLLTSCTAGDTQFTQQDPAGFWTGLWHGIISLVTLLIQIFSDTIKVYETNNTGGWYDFGFLLGVICIWGGGTHYKYKSAERKQRDQEWKEIGDKVELKIMRKLKDWSADEDMSGNQENQAEWDEISDKVEKKLKRKIREWADKD